MSLVFQPRDRLVTDALHRWIRIILLTQVAELWSADISQQHANYTLATATKSLSGPSYSLANFILHF